MRAQPKETSLTSLPQNLPQRHGPDRQIHILDRGPLGCWRRVQLQEFSPLDLGPRLLTSGDPVTENVLWFSLQGQWGTAVMLSRNWSPSEFRFKEPHLGEARPSLSADTCSLGQGTSYVAGIYVAGLRRLHREEQEQRGEFSSSTLSI